MSNTHWLLTAAALLAAFVLAALFLVQCHQRRALRAWLDAPANELPDGIGAWREVFSALQRMRKEESRSRAALVSRLDRFVLSVQALPDGVVLLDADGHIEWCNRAACEHFGLDAARDVGTLLTQIVRHSEFHDFLADFRDGLRRDAPPLLLTHPAAQQVIAVSLIGYAGTAVLVLSRDVSELARVENMRRDFVANVSHELRTPLTVISGFLEQLQIALPPPPEAERCLWLMAEQAERMNRLVADLLMLSRLENDAQPPREDAIEVAGLTATLLAEATALSGGRHTIVASGGEGLRLRGSAEELRSACGNLVSNAVRYTPEGGGITVSWSVDEHGASFAVADDGIGIAAEHLPRLTERFYRVDKGRSTASGGTGLGLAIVKHVVMRHGGSLDIESIPGRGSVFRFRLPASRLLPRS